MIAVALVLCAGVDAFLVPSPLGRAGLLRPRNAVRLSKSVGPSMMAGEQSLAPKPTRAGDGVAAQSPSYGPHIKVGKKGMILNPWGAWVVTYSMVLAFLGYFYLKFREILSIVLMGMLKPTPEHCCWIMHKYVPPFTHALPPAAPRSVLQHGRHTRSRGFLTLRGCEQVVQHRAEVRPVGPAGAPYPRRVHSTAPRVSGR